MVERSPEQRDEEHGPEDVTIPVDAAVAADVLSDAPEAGEDTAAVEADFEAGPA